eukprot:NODE_13902_length_352_cov_2.128713_g12743_i0.p3 GENE.NODE_13902_length_352_cov_2.128713_g12743_i0~~NODE_13902_length_352_cov_2.128713_g12743_i0.p3  ORF type:complete len:61 (+),score=4.53 NODE_13902_length_352_cov_2.128713_g12743_i0:85-267(+)
MHTHRERARAGRRSSRYVSATPRARKLAHPTPVEASSGPPLERVFSPFFPQNQVDLPLIF